MSSGYEFGPIESSGLFGALSVRQVVAGGLGLLAAFLVIQGGSSLSLLWVALILASTFAFVTYPVAGRPCVEWTDIALRFLYRRTLGKLTYVSRAHQYGHVGQAAGAAKSPEDLPSEIAGIEILGATLKGLKVGVAYDKSQSAYTASVSVTSEGFALLDEEDQEAKLHGWAAVMSDFSREDSPISRISWVEQTLPANQDEMKEYLISQIDPDLPRENPAVVSYVKLLADAAAVQQEHELLLTLRLEADRRKTRKMAARLGKRHDGFCALLMRELQHFMSALNAADIKVIGPLKPRSLARTIYGTYNPFAARASATEGVSEHLIGPQVASEAWDLYEAEGVLHRVYWFANWPRSIVGPTFMAPMLLNTTATRKIAVAIEPVPMARAMREAQQAASSEEANADVKAGHGFRISAAKRKNYQAILRREEELSSGYCEVRFAGYVEVCGRDMDELEMACAEIEHAAAQSHIELRKLSGEQAEGLTVVMPLARGLRRSI